MYEYQYEYQMILIHYVTSFTSEYCNTLYKLSTNESVSATILKTIRCAAVLSCDMKLLLLEFGSKPIAVVNHAQFWVNIL